MFGERNDNQPEITIILPTHHSHEYVQQTLDSIANQTFKNYEVLAIDSSFSDDTKAILQENAKSDSRIVIVDDDNSSYGHKINIGIERSSGNYIAIVESDDAIAADFLEKLYNKFRNEKLDFVKCNMAYWVSQGMEDMYIKQPRCVEQDYDRVIDLRSESNLRKCATNHIWTGLYRKDFLIKNRVKLHESPGASYQDIGFSALCNLSARYVMFIADALYYYRVDNANSSVKDNQKYLCVVDEYDWLARELETRGIDDPSSLEYVKHCKYGSFAWNYNRLSGDYRRLFMNRITDIYNDQELESYIVDQFESYKRELDLIHKIKPLLEWIIHNKTIILWGANAVGLSILTIQDSLHLKHIKTVCDNDQTKIGRNYLGYIVSKPNDSMQETTGAKYIIAARNKGKEIRNILLQNGVGEEKSIIVDYVLEHYYNREMLAQTAAKIVTVSE